MKRIILIGLTINLSFGLFAQNETNRVAINNIDDTEATFPEDLEKNYDELLTEWAKQMHLYDDCEYSDSGVITFPDSVYIERLYALPTKMELAFNPTDRKSVV